MTRLAQIGLILLCFFSPVLAQSVAQTSDPQAVALASNAISAMVGSESIHDVTLSGTATWTAGTTETGALTLKALGGTESRIDLTLPDGTRTEIRDAASGVAQGKWINPDGAFGAIAGQNAMTDAAWFFPALGSLSAGPNVILSYLGPEIRNGQPVQHLRAYTQQSQTSSSTSEGPNDQTLSAMDFYLNATSYLPVSLVFNQHPDDNVLINIPTEVDFSDYALISGVQVPAHIRKSMNGSVILDITVTQAVLNSGLPLSDFSVN